jgi:hypothetical protein
MGPAGPQGVQGPSGVVSADVQSGTTQTGTGLPLPAPAYTNQFLAPVAQVTVAAGQRIYVNSVRVLGSTTGGDSLSLWICYQGGGAVTTVGEALAPLRILSGQQLPFEATAVISDLPAGTYAVGLCGRATNVYSHWNANGSGSTTALVLR